MQAPATSDATTPLEGFADLVQTTMAEWKVPGVAVAVVKDGAVVFLEGYGLRDRARNLAVTPHTLFPIASCTKAFTTLGLALLVDEGRLEWDTPVRTYLPDFALHDPVAGERLTPRDLVTHRSGLPRHDLMWYKSPATRAELFARLRYLAPSKDLRATFQYNNLMYMAAGHVIDRLCGQTWEDFTRARILAPLGMLGTLFSTVEAQQTADFARPHKEEKDEVKETAFYEEQDAIGPAGAIVSCVAEMSQWVLLHLNKGRHGDRQLVSGAQIGELHTPQIALPGESKYAELPSPVTYGLGWAIQPYRGHTMIHHSGGIDGFSSLVTLLPREQIGVVVLNNLGSLLPLIVTYNAIDRLLGLEQVPWGQRFMKDHLEFKQGQEKGEQKSAADAVPGTTPSHPLDAYTGDFAHPAYGTIAVAQRDDRLLATINGVARPLAHYHYDIFELKIEEWDLPLKLSFATNARGDIESFAAPLEPAVADIVFTRTPHSQMTEKRFLERFVGEYELMETPMTVALKGENALVLSWPGEPAQELVPYKGTEFRLKDLSGFSIEFRSDATGAVVEALLTQPWAVLTARKKTAGPAPL
jgi:CubicO group peptidase (beta-lactamase class C family)